MTRRLELLLAVAVAGLAACGGGDSTPPPPPPPECTTHTECVAGKYCSDAGACVALAAGTCRKVADCPAGDSCTNNLCVAPVTCTTDDQCAPKFACTASTCTALVPPACHRPVDCNAGETCTANVCVASTAECDKAANTAERARLVAAQPTFGVRSKTVKTFTTTFASVGGDPLVQCPVTLQFKDLNGDDALQPYEDWTLDGRRPRRRPGGPHGRQPEAGAPAPPGPGRQPHAGHSTSCRRPWSLITSGVRFGAASAPPAPQLSRAPPGPTPSRRPARPPRSASPS